MDNVEPIFDEETEEFAGFKSWSQSTARIESFKITSVDGPKLGQEVPSRVTGELTLNLSDLPEALRAKFVSDLETLYLVKFSPSKKLKLVRGCTVTNAATVVGSSLASSVKFSVELDGAQYKMDMMRLAVEDSMFVEESYTACHAVVKMPPMLGSSKRISQLKALIQLVQKAATEMPLWLQRSLLGHKVKIGP